MARSYSSAFGIAAPAIALAAMVAAGVASPLGAQLSCGRGAVTVAGELLDREGRPLANVMLAIGERCLVHTDDDGRFTVSGLPPTRALIRPAVMLVCVEPVWIEPTQPRLEVRLVGTHIPNPMDDTRFMVRGGPYVPPTYEQFRCLAENLDPPEPGAAAFVPTPDEALGWALNHPESEPLLRRAASEHAVVPLMFHYGPLEASPPPAPVAYERGGDRTRGYVYVIVLRSSHRRLEVQLGYNRAREDDSGPTDAGDGIRGRTYVEDGMRLEWLREDGQWDQGRVLERWEAPPLAR